LAGHLLGPLHPERQPILVTSHRLMSGRQVEDVYPPLVIPLFFLSKGRLVSARNIVACGALVCILILSIRVGNRCLLVPVFSSSLQAVPSSSR
jgi:hypothetical protein